MASINPQIFREYDIRGLVGSDLTDETVELLGQGAWDAGAAGGESRFSR